MFILYNIINIGGRVWGVKLGYYEGMDFITKNNESNILQRVTNMANVVGLMVIGSMIATIVKIKMPLKIEAGENIIVLQDMLDSVMPNLLGLLVTILIYKWFRKTQGKHTALTIIFLIAASVGATYIGLL